MELCGGGSVGDYVDSRGAFSERGAKPLLLQLFAGVDYLHGRRIVHRDIKPSNLLLLHGAEGLRISDFGSARRIGQHAVDAAMLSDRGTQLFSAPELRFGLMWNERVDIWAAGLCAFFILHAELPFDPASRRALQALHVGRLPDISWGEVGATIKNLVLQCLTVHLQDRPTAMELMLHPALADPGGGAAAARASSCGLPGTAGLQPQKRSPFEEALRQLVANRLLRGVAVGQAVQPSAHSCYF